jgi:hypothetical protein
MRSHRLLIWAAWLVFTAAWFLPIAKEGVTLPQGLPGWQAFRVAASAVWPLADVTIDTWYKAVLFTISAITTLLFFPGSAWAVWSGSRTLRRAFAWAATSAFVVNAHWYVLYGGSAREDLRVGYFFWWFSFLLVALGLFDLSRRG